MDNVYRTLIEKGFVLQPDGSYSKPGNARQTPAQPIESPQPPVLDVIVSASTDVENLNKLERDWYVVLQGKGFAWLGVQNMTLKLADRCRYTPDFSAVTTQGRFHFYETKGWMRPDAEIKLKTAARLFPWAKFILVTRVKGEWNQKEINT